jgi:hypothetical protein
MIKTRLLWISGVFLLSNIICLFPGAIYAQIPSKTAVTSNTASESEGVVSVTATVSVKVSNGTLENQEKMLRNSVITFISSGANVLKSSPTVAPNVNTKINNNVNNVTQIVQGIEATNAVVAVEISKALKTVISSSTDTNQTGDITIGTTSTCRPIVLKSITCENTVTIK